MTTPGSPFEGARVYVRVAIGTLTAASLLAACGSSHQALAPDAAGRASTSIRNSSGAPVVGKRISFADASTDAIAITPDGRSVYVVSNSTSSVIPVTLATGFAGTPIRVGPGPDGIAITPDGRIAYVANAGDDTVTPITLATGTAGTPITRAELRAHEFEPRRVAARPKPRRTTATGESTAGV